MKRLLLTLVVALLAGSPILAESAPFQAASTGKPQTIRAAKHARKHARKHHRKHRKRTRRTHVRRTVLNRGFITRTPARAS
jgi:Ni/Co efflux regulator RcnB